MKVDTAEANCRCAAALIHTLSRLGVGHFVISSGSRCAPLVFAAALHPSVTVHRHYDERSAGFMALGIGKALRQPAALICTSGTAGANFYPAVIEARMSRTPLVVLTADRPPSLRGRGAPQTIDQVDLYSNYPLDFCDLPLPTDDIDDVVAQWIVCAHRAFRQCIGSPAGPVHLNAPFDEPLLLPPDRLERTLRAVYQQSDRLPDERQTGYADLSNAVDWDALADRIRLARRVLIICGPQNDTDGLADGVRELAVSLNAPVFSDVASQCRFASSVQNIVQPYSFYFSGPAADELAPDLVIRFGGLPTSKTLNDWLAQIRPRDYIAIDSGDIADPQRCVTTAVRADLNVACRALADALHGSTAKDPFYLDCWMTRDQAAGDALRQMQADRTDHAPFEGDIAACVCRDAPEGSTIVLSSGLPIRMADSYADGRDEYLRIVCNRGANGIDGVISTAVGAALARPDLPTTCLIGDLAFLHDVNGLWAAARVAESLKIILVNNNGGGMFSFLPIADHGGFFEKLVAMPPDCDPAQLASAYRIPHRRVDSLREFENVYARCFDTNAPEIIEVRTDRQATLAIHRDILRRVAAL